MAEQEAQQKFNWRWLHIPIILFLMFGFGYIQPVGALTEMGMQVVGVFLGILWGWIFVGIGWPSMLGLIAFGLTDACTMGEAFAKGFGSQNAVLILAMLIITAFIEQAGLSQVIINWLLTRKITKGRPYLTVFFFIFACFLTALVGYGLAACVFFIEIFNALAQKVNLKPYSRQIPVFLVGIALTTAIGDMALPFKSSAILFISTFESATGMVIDLARYTAFAFLGSLLLMVAYVLLCKIILRIDMSMISQVGELINVETRVTLRQKVSLIFIGILMLVLILPGLLPKTWGVYIFLNEMGLGGIAYCLVAILLIVHVEGKPLLSLSEMAGNFKWDVYVLVVVFLPIAATLTSDDTGLKPFLSNILAPIANGLSPVVFVLFMVMVTAVLTNIANNMVLGAIVISILTVVGESIQGINMIAMAVLLMFAAEFSMFLPSANPINAILFSQTEWVTFKGEMKHGLITCGCLCLVLVIVYWPIACIIF